MRAPTPTAKAMLDLTGFADEAALIRAYTEARKQDTTDARIVQEIASAFNDLESAERRLRRALDNLARLVPDMRNAIDGLNAEGGPRPSGPVQPNTDWLTGTARDAAEANADMDRAAGRIRQLVWLRGKAPAA